MKLSKTLLFTPIIALSLAFSPITQAHIAKEGDCACIQKIQEELNLTKEQQEKVKAIKEQAKASMKKNIDTLKSNRQHMEQIVRAETLDEAALDKLVSQQMAVKASIMKNRAINQHQIYSILTPEQRVKFNEMKEKNKNAKCAGKMKQCHGKNAQE